MRINQLKTALSHSEAGKQLTQDVLKDLDSVTVDNHTAKAHSTGMSTNRDREIAQIKNERDNLAMELQMVRAGGGDKTEKQVNYLTSKVSNLALTSFRFLTMKRQWGPWSLNALNCKLGLLWRKSNSKI